jgi:hypothetical protein
MKLKWWYIALMIVCMLALLSPLASKLPDGLDKAAESLGFTDKGVANVLHVMPDYAFPGMGNRPAATIVAAVVGILIVFAAAIGIGALLKRNSRHET